MQLILFYVVHRLDSNNMKGLHMQLSKEICICSALG